MIAIWRSFDVPWAAWVERAERVCLRRRESGGLVWRVIRREARRSGSFVAPAPSEAWGGNAGVVPAFVEVRRTAHSLGLTAATADNQVTPDTEACEN